MQNFGRGRLEFEPGCSRAVLVAPSSRTPELVACFGGGKGFCFGMLAWPFSVPTRLNREAEKQTNRVKPGSRTPRWPAQRMGKQQSDPGKSPIFIFCGSNVRRRCGYTCIFLVRGRVVKRSPASVSFESQLRALTVRKFLVPALNGLPVAS